MSQGNIQYYLSLWSDFLERRFGLCFLLAADIHAYFWPSSFGRSLYLIFSPSFIMKYLAKGHIIYA